MQEIKKEIKNLLAVADVKGDVQLTTPPNPEMGDFAFACFGVGKEWQMSPKDAADKIKEKIKDKKSKMVARVETAGPYVNFYLQPGEVASLVVKEIGKQGKKYGDNKSGKGKKVLIEYPSNNTHKEFHIGHFRNVAIGNTLVRLYEKNGYKVYPVNYLNDFGNHVAKCLWGLLKFHKNEQPPENCQKWLGDIYAEASQQVRDNPDFGKEVAEIQKKLEEHDPEIWPLFMKTREWSIEKFEEIFKQLGVKHAAVFYEKDLKDRGQKMTDELLFKGVAEIGEGGAVIVDLSKYNLDIALLRKSNGAGLYLTSDLPLAVEKFKKFNVDESIVITGTEQNFYFKQLYKILEIIGFNKKLTHIGYGLVNLKEGKMSSRFGNVILYEDLYYEVYEKLKMESKQRHADWSEKQVNKTAHVLAMAALKFDMLKHEAAKNITFDIKEATAVDGFTGPYILYVVARINSILEKAKDEKIKAKGDYELLDKPEEKQLLLFLSQYEEIVSDALREYNPSTITRYCFDLAQKFNDFYTKHSVLNAENKELIAARLQLCIAVKNVLENTLDLLTINTVEEM
ncbi:MAG: arginyl-tRNA synthetase [Parcubacteria group bacterium Gr01-1014_13]|nr:MAG: arginyl-tRNA synthetase [Parcubacteria group bacterium Gr01-1014_13]